MINILVIDDHPLIVDALAQLLPQTHTDIVVRTALNPCDAIVVLDNEPDVALIVLDLALPDACGVRCGYAFGRCARSCVIQSPKGAIPEFLEAREHPLPRWRDRLHWVADSTGRCSTLDAIAAEGVLQMKQRPRIYYSVSQQALIWERWRKGETLHQIARLFDRYHSSIQGILAESGGIVRFLVTGKVTCSSAARTARSRRSLNVNHAT